MVKPYFSPEVTLGNLIQVISLITMIGGGALTSYVSLRNDIAVSGERSGKAIADMNARVLVLEARREMDERFQQEARRDLGRLLEAVADLRVQLVRKQESGSNASK
ncbi:MAG: hypothetical protein AB7H90_11385 [Alphaproteobacteria bacterium]